MRWRSMLLPAAMVALGAACIAYARRPRWWWNPYSNPEQMDHLLAVGPSKPLGYLSWATLTENGFDPYDLARRFRMAGLRTMLVEPAEDKFPWGALYLFDEAVLQRLLDQHRDVLRDAGWPEDAKTFVRWVSAVSVQPERKPRLYRLVGMAFHDPRFASV
jgi:hypothetical protein